VKTKTLSLSAAAATVAAVICAVAASPPAAAAGEFYLDYGVFYRLPDYAPLLEVYFAVPLDILTPADEDGDSVYDFNVGVQLKRAADGAVVAAPVVAKTARVSADAPVKSPLSVGQLVLAVPPDEYVLTFGVGDLNSKQSHLSEFAVAVPAAPAEGPFISSLELASSMAPVEAGAVGEFVKNGLSIIPNPTKLVSDRGGTVSVYYELYRLPAAGGERGPALRYEILLASGKAAVKAERELATGAADVVRTETLDLAGVPPGSYVLSLKVVRPDGAALVSSRKEFVIYHEYAPEEVADIRDRFRPFSQEENKRVRKELSLVATPAELTAFDALPDEEKPLFVENFWQRRDPDKATPDNEFKNAFYNRYQYIQDHYSMPFREGVDTDRGRIYLKYGQPDQVITNPLGLPSQTDIDASSWQSKPFEAWEYLKTGGVDNQYILFVFVDVDGDGSYQLDSSTVPGYGRLIRATGPQTGG